MNDSKFYNSTLNNFLRDGRFECKSLLYLDSNESCTIQETSLLEIIHSDKKKLKKRLEKNDYDVIYFFSMRVLWWQFLSYIPKDKVVVWWGWGYDLYERQNRGVAPLLKIPLYKEITKGYIDRIHSGMIERISTSLKTITIGFFYDYIRRVNMKRVDYFKPVLSIEYDMLKSLKTFKAQEIYFPEGAGFFYRDSIQLNDPNGAILLGNSASFTNNHLDVWDSIKHFIPERREVIIPLSYGDKKYADFVVDGVKSDNLMINALTDFMPYEEYMKVFNRCSYAVYGVIRQQAMGNIFVALRQGLKLFLYRESIVYKHLKKNGYCVFAIEDIDENSFKTPLGVDGIEQNRKAAINDFNERQSVAEKAIKEIQDTINVNRR